MDVTSFLRFLFILFALLSALSARASCDQWLIEGTRSSEVAHIQLDHEILKIIAPSFQLAEKIIAQMPAAQNLEELKSQIRVIMENKEISDLYQAENLELDRLAPKMSTYGPFGLANYAGVVPGVFRSANPTLEQAEELIHSGVVDYIFSLNYELDLLTKLDNSQSGPLNEARRQALMNELESKGFAPARAASEISFYERHLTYAQAVTNRTLPYQRHFLLNHPKDELEGFFTALVQVLEIQAQGKSILFHCSIGKHRTGLLAMLVKAVKKDGLLTRSELENLYIEFIRHNWNDKPVTRLQYLFFFPLILKSKPFKAIAETY